MVQMVESSQAVISIRDLPARSTGAAALRPIPAKSILLFIAACALGKVFAAWATGFTGDEAYTIVIARTLALSYFDHPPLHQCASLERRRKGLKVRRMPQR